LGFVPRWEKSERRVAGGLQFPITGAPRGTGRKPPPKQSLSGAPSRVSSRFSLGQPPYFQIDPEFPWSEEHSKLWFVYGNIGLLNLLRPDNSSTTVTATDPAALNTPSLTSQANMLALHNEFAKFPDLCNPGFGATAKVDRAAANLDVNQTGVEGSYTLEAGPISFEKPSAVSLNFGQEIGVTIGVNPVNHTVTSAGLFVGFKTKLVELNANIHAAVVNMFACQN
jgi:hypothetical protein